MLENLQIPKAVATSSNRRFAERALAFFDLEPRFEFILTSEDVSRGKPDPEIYLKGLQVLGITSAEAVVVEDSRVGLMAAAAAGITCLVTVNGYTAREDTSGADLVVSELGDPPDVQVTLDTVRELVKH
jgi:beta-phosphoglucomutase-like phosphatase (HAD superfamily)